jgi:hypothetical protein
LSLRIAGVVVGTSQPPPARWQVRVGRRRWQRSDGGWFEVEASGVRTWVEVTSLVEILGDPVESDGVLEDLAQQAGLVGELGPAGTPARLSHIAVSSGTEVAVLGELRGSTILHGDLVACGPNAVARLDEIIARRATTAPRPPGRPRRGRT